MGFFGLEWYVVSLVCFVLYYVSFAIGCGKFFRHMLPGDYVGMVIVSVVPILNLLFALLSVLAMVKVTYVSVKESMS